MSLPSLTPVVEVENFDPPDLISVVQSTSDHLPANSAFLDPIGIGYSPFMRWSLEDIAAARQAPAGDTQTRFCTSALMNARRGLSCLVDQYLMRDGFAFCSDAPKDAETKAELLEEVSKPLQHSVQASEVHEALE